MRGAGPTVPGQKPGRGYPVALRNCGNCGLPMAKAKPAFRYFVFCSLACAAASRRRCECEQPILVAEDDGTDRHCFKCGNPCPDVGAGSLSSPVGAVGSGAGAGGNHNGRHPSGLTGARFLSEAA